MTHATSKIGRPSRLDDPAYRAEFPALYGTMTNEKLAEKLDVKLRTVELHAQILKLTKKKGRGLTSSDPTTPNEGPATQSTTSIPSAKPGASAGGNN